MISTHKQRQLLAMMAHRLFGTINASTWDLFFRPSFPESDEALARLWVVALRTIADVVEKSYTDRQADLNALIQDALAFHLADVDMERR